MKPIDQLIVEDVVEALRAIVPAFDVRMVLEQAVSPADRMLIVAGTEPEPQSPAPCGFDELILHVQMVVFSIQSIASTVAIRSRLSGFAADIRKKLLQDRHRSGLAVNTRFDSPDEYHTEQNPPSVTVTASVRYQTLRDNPYSQS